MTQVLNIIFNPLKPKVKCNQCTKSLTLDICRKHKLITCSTCEKDNNCSSCSIDFCDHLLFICKVDSKANIISKTETHPIRCHNCETLFCNYCFKKEMVSCATCSFIVCGECSDLFTSCVSCELDICEECTYTRRYKFSDDQYCCMCV